MASVQPELWLDGAEAAVAFYIEAFGANVLHRVGDGDDIVVQLAVDDVAFWITSADSGRRRFSPSVIGGTTGRTLLVVDDLDGFFARAANAGATVAEMANEHGWRLGRIIDPLRSRVGDRQATRDLAAVLTTRRGLGRGGNSPLSETAKCCVIERSQ